MNLLEGGLVPVGHNEDISRIYLILVQIRALKSATDVKLGLSGPQRFEIDGKEYDISLLDQVDVVNPTIVCKPVSEEQYDRLFWHMLSLESLRHPWRFTAYSDILTDEESAALDLAAKTLGGDGPLNSGDEAINPRIRGEHVRVMKPVWKDGVAVQLDILGVDSALRNLRTVGYFVRNRGENWRLAPPRSA